MGKGGIELDLNQYRIQEQEIAGRKEVPSCRKKRLPRFKSRFLRGPVPLGWLQAAIRAGGAAISVGIMLWHLHGMKKSFTFKVGIGDLATLMGKRWGTSQSGLIALERENLISVQRHAGRKPIITILTNEEKGEDNENNQVR